MASKLRALVENVMLGGVFVIACYVGGETTHRVLGRSYEGTAREREKICEDRLIRQRERHRASLERAKEIRERHKALLEELDEMRRR